MDAARRPSPDSVRLAGNPHQLGQVRRLDRLRRSVRWRPQVEPARHPVQRPAAGTGDPGQRVLDPGRGKSIFIEREPRLRIGGRQRRAYDAPVAVHLGHRQVVDHPRPHRPNHHLGDSQVVLLRNRSGRVMQLGQPGGVRATLARRRPLRSGQSRRRHEAARACPRQPARPREQAAAIQPRHLRHPHVAARHLRQCRHVLFQPPPSGYRPPARQDRLLAAVIAKRDPIRRRRTVVRPDDQRRVEAVGATAQLDRHVMGSPAAHRCAHGTARTRRASERPLQRSRRGVVAGGRNKVSHRGSQHIVQSV